MRTLHCFVVAVHFWAPTFKWGISIANIADFSKPPENLSYPQQIGLFDGAAVLCFSKVKTMCEHAHHIHIGF